VAAEPDPREAIVARRDQIAAGPHPKQLYQPPDPGGADDDVYRLYRNEWVIAYTAVATPDGYQPDGLADACRRHFDDHYTGRVHNGDAKVIVEGTEATAIGRLMLHLPVMKGEFKLAFLAHRFAAEQGWEEYLVVARHSPSDHELRQYGTRKLVSRSP
jgi:hypothetical protein